MAPRMKPKRYVCSWEGCDKAFTRSDHLQRHVLNHGTEGRTCPRCSLHFKRLDLLERHLLRHRQKDEQAGGDGLGVMDSRKKLWKDADGNIVKKRPVPREADSASEERFISTYDVLGDVYQNQAPNAPISPPQSMPSMESSEPIIQSFAEMPDIMDLGGDVMGLDMFDFLANSAWGAAPSRPADGLPNAMPFDDTFNPDTASSFNMPFTTMANYNWLFDIQEDGPTQPETCQIPEVSVINIEPQPEHQSIDVTVGVDSFELSTDATGANPSPIGDFLNGMSWQATRSDDPLAQDYNSEASVLGATKEQLPWQSSLVSIECQTQPQAELPHQWRGDQVQDGLGSPDNFATPSITGSRSASQTSRHSVPMIDNTSRNKLLSLIEVARAVTPTGTIIDRHHPLLTISSLQTCMDLYFSHFNRVYPLLHKPTFDPAQTEPLLLLAILLLGATYGNKSLHTLAVCIHDGMRGQVFQHVAFTATPELWMIQTILLIECFGKSRAGQKQHDMSHLFHGLLINLIRRSDCQTVVTPNLSHSSNDLESQWQKAIDAEHRKRLAFFCFLWDTQHAVLFSQSLCMSSFELRTTLPCSQATWEADSAHEWLRHARQEKQISFLAVLKSYVNPESHTPPPELDSVSRLLVLHGLMSIQWDMRRRDQASLGVDKSNATLLKGQSLWQECLARSYEAWKADFDTFCMNMTLSMSHDSPERLEFIRYSTATTAIYHAAHITLNVEILDLQISAGARHILGRPVSGADFSRSRKIIQDWAKSGTSPSASKATWHAAHLLRDGIMNLDNWDVNDAFHYPWCLYLSVLTCWAFYVANDSDKTRKTKTSAHERGEKSNNLPQNPRNCNSTPNDRVTWSAKVEMNSLVSSLTSVMPENLNRVLGKHSPSGLIVVMTEHLSNIRWAIVHEGVKTLKSLTNDSWTY